MTLSPLASQPLSHTLAEFKAGRLTEYELYRALCDREYISTPRDPRPIWERYDEDNGWPPVGSFAEVDMANTSKRIPDRVYQAVWKTYAKKMGFPAT